MRPFVSQLTSPKHKFARKILRAKTTDPLDWRLEKIALQAISAQQHPNIIELLFVYQWRDQYNFVFPFVEKNLHEVIRLQWCPRNIKVTKTTPFEAHWLWQQMVQVASGLKTIHQPSKRYAGSSEEVIGFHFDLKPANILVTNEGVLKIIDFGQALIKSVGADDLTYGINRGGSLIYQAPEARPTRKGLESGNMDGRLYRRYDVWSLACIMLQVLTYIFDGPENGTARFEKDRADEPEGKAFYSTTTTTEQIKLKRCVKAMLQRYGSERLPRPANSAYLRNVLKLLQCMFAIEQQSRPTSERVYAELESFDQTLSGLQQRDVYHKLHLLAHYPVPEGYSDIGWLAGSTLCSFSEMDSVCYRSSNNASSASIPCRFRILMSIKNGSLRLERSWIEENSSEDLKTGRFPLGDTSYIPLDLYDKMSNSSIARAYITGRTFHHGY